jgi:tripartite-type tricarboxylate transporter receptor subunit TctC
MEIMRFSDAVRTAMQVAVRAVDRAAVATSGRRIVRDALLAATLILPFAAHAQSDYPTSPVHLIVPQAAGGPSDVLARMLGVRLGDALGQVIVVENRPGAGTVLGTNAVARAKPDGMMLLIQIVETLAINESLYTKLPYVLATDLKPVGLVASSSATLVAKKDLPAHNYAELKTLALQKPPGTLSVGTAGIGSIFHMATELVNMTAGIKLTHVPYKGGEPAIIDVVAGHVDLAFVGTPAAVELIRQNKVTAIGTTGRTRDAQLPDVPTFAESGAPNFDVEATYAILVPAGTPQPIIDKLAAAVKKIDESPDFKKQVGAIGFDSHFASPSETAAMLKASVEKWRPIVKASGATVD